MLSSTLLDGTQRRHVHNRNGDCIPWCLSFLHFFFAKPFKAPLDNCNPSAWEAGRADYEKRQRACIFVIVWSAPLSNRLRRHRFRTDWWLRMASCKSPSGHRIGSRQHASGWRKEALRNSVCALRDMLHARHVILRLNEYLHYFDLSTFTTLTRSASSFSQGMP